MSQIVLGTIQETLLYATRYLTFLLASVKDIEKTCSCSTSPGSHSSSFSNDQNLILNQFQISDSRKPIIFFHNAAVNTQQPGFDQSVQCHSLPRARMQPRAFQEDLRLRKSSVSSWLSQLLHLNVSEPTHEAYPLPPRSQHRVFGKILGTYHVIKDPDICPLAAPNLA